MNYRRVVVSRFGGPEVLEVCSQAVPDPGPGEARVRVLAAGVSFGDVLARTGALPDGPKRPFTPGFDIVGVVDAVGPDVTTPQVGTRVAALVDQGGYAEIACLPAERLIPLPDGVDPIDAAAASLNYFAAHQMLHRVTRLTEGQKILVLGAAGGIGSAVLDLARRAGLKAYGTASRSKHELVAGLGAVPIDYRSEDVLARLRSLTGDGVDATFDGIGGLSFLRSHRALRPGGHLVAYGVSAAASDGQGSRPKSIASFLGVKLLALLPTGRAATFYTASGLDKRQPGTYHADLTAVLNLLAEREIQPIIAERRELNDAAHTHDLLARAAVSGKIVLTMAGSQP